MGDYTGLRMKCVIKPEYRDSIEKLMKNDDTYEWKDFDNPVIQEFGERDRCDFIPFGMLSYMPDSWGEEMMYDNRGNVLLDSNGFCRYTPPEIRRTYCKGSGRWEFQCSLKNYQRDVDFFIERVVPIICESVEFCEKYFEYDLRSTLYKLVDGEMCPEEGYAYRDEETML